VPPSYYAQAGGGNVTVSGGVNVLRTTGVNFDVRWVGYPILISGQAAIVGAVLDANHITLASPVLTVGTGEWLMPALAWQASAAVLAGSHGLRLGLVVTALPVGTVFLETDRNAVYTILANGLLNANTWNYISGEYADVFANRPTDLGPFDLGFIFTAIDVHFSERWANGWTYYAGVAQGSLFQMNALPLIAAENGLLFAETTYGHLYVWSGTSWAFAPGDSGAGYIVFGPEPLGGIWYPCNGASYSISAGNGGLTTVVTPNITGTLAALYGGGYNVNPIPSITPTVTVNVAATKTVSGLSPGTDLAAGQSIIPTINPGNPEYFSLSAWIRG
jgi:hypothetical protein